MTELVALTKTTIATSKALLKEADRLLALRFATTYASGGFSKKNLLDEIKRGDSDAKLYAGLLPRHLVVADSVLMQEFGKKVARVGAQKGALLRTNFLYTRDYVLPIRRVPQNNSSK